MIVSVKLSLLLMVIIDEDDEEPNEMLELTKGSRGSLLVGDSTSEPATLL